MFCRTASGMAGGSAAASRAAGTAPPSPRAAHGAASVPGLGAPAGRARRRQAAPLPLSRSNAQKQRTDDATARPSGGRMERWSCECAVRRCLLCSASRGASCRRVLWAHCRLAPCVCMRVRVLLAPVPSGSGSGSSSAKAATVLDNAAGQSAAAPVRLQSRGRCRGRCRPELHWDGGSLVSALGDASTRDAPAGLTLALRRSEQA